MHEYLIAPSILSANFASLGQEVHDVMNAGGDLIHFDAMDNHYVSNLTVGPPVLKSLRNSGIDVPIDVHVMANPACDLINKFISYGANCISFHPGTTKDTYQTIQKIQQQGCNVGLVVNPKDLIISYEEFLVNCRIDSLLLMSVEPGLGGQQFIEKTIEKIQQAKAILEKYNLFTKIGIDGGVKVCNVKRIAQAGANMFVVGSEIFTSHNYSKIIQNIKKELNTNVKKY